MKRMLFFVCLFGIVMGMMSCDDKQEEPQNVVNEITIYGNVIDRATGQPLYNVLIQEKNKVGGSTVTGNDGNYEFTLPLNGSSNGKYYLVASKSLYLGAEYELSLSNVDKGRAIRVDFQLEMGVFHVKGKVTDQDGKPLSNVLIKETYQNTGNSVYSDRDGDYRLELYPYSEHSNKYVLKASATDYYSEEYTLNFTEKDYGRTSTVNFQLTTSVKPIKYCYIKGNVTASYSSVLFNNQPVGKVLIQGYKHKDKNNIDWSNLEVSAYTDSYGNYTIEQPIDGECPYHTYTAEKQYWYMYIYEGRSEYTKKTLLVNESAEGQTFYIDWDAQVTGSSAKRN